MRFDLDNKKFFILIVSFALVGSYLLVNYSGIDFHDIFFQLFDIEGDYFIYGIVFIIVLFAPGLLIFLDIMADSTYFMVTGFPSAKEWKYIYLGVMVLVLFIIVYFSFLE